MQITLRFDESLMRRAREAAAAEGLTLTAYIADAVRQKLADSKNSKRGQKTRFPVGDTGGLLPGVPPIYDGRALRDYLDELDEPSKA